MKLIKPNIKYQSSYLSYLKELGDEERYPFPLDFDHTNFPGMLQKIDDFEQGENLPDGYVPSSTYWMIDGTEIAGISNLRHELNESLLIAGGHIGLGIRPTYRGQKLSTQLLKLTLEKARLRNIYQVHIHCYANNPASANMIKACGGVFDSEVYLNNNIIQRFVIAV